MNLIIFSPTSTELMLDDKQPLGGADTTLLKMIEILSIEHNVEAYIPIKENKKYYNAECYPFMDLFNKKKDCDILIFYRKIWAVPNTVNYKKLIFYSQDTIETPCYGGIKDKSCFMIFDNIILLSEFHKQNFLSIFDYPIEKISIIGNAAETREPVKKEPLTFIYMSTPYRGLVVLMKLWKKIIEKYPTAKLHVYSSMAIYGAEILDEMHFRPMLDNLDNMKGVISHGSRPREEVLKQLDKSQLLLYPNTYPETYCNVIMESRAAYTPFISSQLGALPETGKKAGIYIRGSAYNEKYQAEFLSVLDEILLSPGKYEQLQQNCYPIRTWIEYKKDLLTCLKN